MPEPTAPGEEPEAPTTDPSGSIVSEWLSASQDPLAEMMSVTVGNHEGVTVFHCAIDAGDVPTVAARCAVELAATRLRYWPADFFHWLHASSGEAGADAERLERLQIVLCKNLGTPEDKAPESHLCGLVGETLLASVLSTIDRGLGTPILFEGHDWSVTDPGGDCLVLSESHGDLRFQLWEAKAIYGTTATGSVIKSAAEQLHTRAAEYLARFATVAERAELPEGVGTFLLQLKDLWVDDAPSKHAGVAVATHASKCTDGSFGKIEEILEMPVGRSHGHYTSAPNFLGFANLVRASVWKGCGLA